MDNVTFTHSVLRKHTIDPLEGHTVVVLEQIGDAGEKFRFEIQPEHEPQKPSRFRLPWRAQPNYFAYAVPSSPMHAQFGADIRMDDLLHAFVMKIHVVFVVSEPRLVVTRRNDDPLKLVRDEIVRLVQKYVAPYRWSDVTNEFRRLEATVAGDVLAAVRPIASGCGLRVQDLSLSHDVPRDQIDDKVRDQVHADAKDAIQKKAELEALEDELKVKRQDLEAERAAFRRSMEMADGSVRALTTALQNAAGTVHNPAELMQTLVSINALVEDLRSPDRGRFGAAALPAGRASGLLGNGKPQQNGLGSVLADIVFATDAIACSGDTKKRLQAALLHVVAELLPDEPPDEKALQGAIERARTAGSEARLSASQLESLKELLNPRQLRERLV